MSAITFTILCLFIGFGPRVLHAATGADKEAEIQSPTGPGNIYLIAELNPGASSNNDKTGFYKIGLTGNEISERLGRLQAGNARKLVVAKSAKVTNMLGAEKEAHDKCKTYHTTSKSGNWGGTEWFEVSSSQYDAFVKKFDEAAKKFEEKKTSPRGLPTKSRGLSLTRKKVSIKKPVKPRRRPRPRNLNNIELLQAIAQMFKLE